MDVFVGFDCPEIGFVRIALQSILALGLLLSHPSWMLAGQHPCSSSLSSQG